MAGGGLDVRITGAGELASLGRRLKDAGEAGKALRRELLKQIQRETKDLKESDKQSARDVLPHKGGLAEKVAASKFQTRTRFAGNNVGVKIVAQGLSVSNLRALNRGYVRHPVWGHRDRWVNQPIHPGWFDNPNEKDTPKVQRAILAAIDLTNSRIAKGR